MPHWTRDAPWWLLALLTGLPFGAVMGLVAGRQQHASLTVAVVVGLTSGVVFGVVMGSFAAGQQRRLRVATSDLTDRGRREATRAAVRGPVPGDPEIRAAARDVAQAGLVQMARLRTPALVLFGLLAVLDTVTAVLRPSGWRWAAAAFFVAMICLQVWWPTRLRRRLRLLTDRHEVPGP